MLQKYDNHIFVFLFTALQYHISTVAHVWRVSPWIL